MKVADILDRCCAVDSAGHKLALAVRELKAVAQAIQTPRAVLAVAEGQRVMNNLINEK